MILALKQKMAASIAVHIPQDNVAFDILTNGFFDGERDKDGFKVRNGFNDYYIEKDKRNFREFGKRVKPVVLDEMINFAIQDIPTRISNCQSLSFLLQEKNKVKIKNIFINSTKEEVLTQLAMRSSIKESIRSMLKSEDRGGSDSVIYSNRFDIVFDDFIKNFNKSYAASYGWNFSFVAFVKHSFKAFYYPSHKRDIWYTLNSIDYAKREVEMNAPAVNIVPNKSVGDIFVRHFLIYISELNELLFTHSGQTSDAHGVHYDICYMLINYLCEKKIININNQLIKENCSFRVNIIDEQDRKVSRPGFSENKGIASKIANGKNIVHYVFDVIANQDWDPDTIHLLREACFSLGKKDRDGRNSVWKDVEYNAETSRYFDVVDTPHNYEAFNAIFNGVASAYSLMRIIEDKGRTLVDEYYKYEKVLKDKRYPRSLDTVSSIDRIDLVEKLQLEAEEGLCPPANNRGELLTFPEMVYQYAGSEQNNHENIRNNRKYAISRGFNENTKTKQSGNFQTFFEQLLSVADYMTSIPRSFEEYIVALIRDKKVPINYGTPIKVDPREIISSRFHDLKSNKYMTVNPDLGSYYLYSVSKGDSQLEPLDWKLGTSWYSCVSLIKNTTEGVAKFCCLYVPMMGKFLCIPDNTVLHNDKFNVKRADDLLYDKNSSFVNGIRNTDLFISFFSLPYNAYRPFIDREINDEELDKLLNNSIGFDSMIGINNLMSFAITKKLSDVPVYYKYQSLCDKYLSVISTLSILQLSFIDLLQTMYSYSLYLVNSDDMSITKYDASQGKILFNSLMKSEFIEDNLNWFFDKLNIELSYTKLKKPNFSWGTVNNNDIEFTNLDLSIMSLINGQDTILSSDDYSFDISLDLVLGFDSPAKRFVQLYNLLNIRLTFLRLLRDAYTLSFQTVRKNEIHSFACELNSRFKLCEILKGFRDKVIPNSSERCKYAVIDTLSSDDIFDFAGTIRMNSYNEFSILCEELQKYFGLCKKSLLSLVDYETTESSPVKSRLKEFGSVFYKLGSLDYYPFIKTLLGDVRLKTDRDDSGFLICRNNYFKGTDGANEYYVHYTGYLLKVDKNNKVTPMKFKFENEDDKKRYSSIIRGGKARFGW